MKTTYKVSLLFMLPLLTASLTAFKSSGMTPNGLKISRSSKAGENLVLHVVNVEDYIYLNDPQHGYDEPNLDEQFETFLHTNYPEYRNAQIVYDTTDTPETMYNELKTGKSRIDLMCPSDYMIQKMLSEGMLEKIDRSHVPHYQTYASPVISQYIDTIQATTKSGETELVGDYCVGYMWGTLGILFNPTYSVYSNRDLTDEDVIDMMRSWDALWDKKLDGTISIKDSIRDTLAVAIMHHYDEDLTTLREKLINGQISLEDYKSTLDSYFNKFSGNEWTEELEQVKKEIYEEMLTLKANIYGLEVDNGKNDIVTRKIGTNLAWSGDAVYAISQAADPNETSGKPFDLYYSVPETGSNIWFDGWVMPKSSSRSEEITRLAEIFLDFLSTPEIASKNMDYTGYTPFIGGYDILSLTRDWYDIRTEELTYNDLDVCYLDPNTNEYVGVGYDVFLTTFHDSSKDSLELFVNEGEEGEDDWQNVLADDGVSYKTYGDLTIVDADDSEYSEVDLSYFFEGTLIVDDLEEGESVKASDYLLYTDEYFIAEDNNAVGGAFYTQFPDADTINRCCIMKDFAGNNAKILELWEDFKSGELKPFVIIILSVEVGAALTFGIYTISKKKISKALRSKRKASRQA